MNMLVAYKCYYTFNVLDIQTFIYTHVNCNNYTKYETLVSFMCNKARSHVFFD